MGINLEVPLEMIDAGISSLNTGVNLLASSYLFLDSDDYDGATYTFEIVAFNSHATNDYTVNLYDVTSSEVKATITVPKNTINPTRFRSGPWSPTDATNRTYGIQLAQTDVDDRLSVFVARIIITQVNATKTRIQIPLINYSIVSANKTLSVIDFTTSSDYVQGTPQRYSYYLKNTSVLSSISGWSLEALLWNESPTRNAYLGLFNATDNIQVTGAEISVYGSTPTLVSIELANDAANFDEGDVFEGRIKRDGSGVYKADIAKAALYCRLTNLVKAEIFWRLGREGSGKTIVTYPSGRALLNTSALSNPTIYFEASAICADNAQIVFLRDHLTNDSGTDGSEVVGSGLNFNSATKVRIRSGALTLTDDDRFYAYKIASTNVVTLSNCWVIIDVAGTIPEIIDQSGDTVVNEGEEVNLFVTATGVPTPEYQWYFEDVEIPGETNSTLEFIADRADTGTYKCRAYNVVGEDWSDPIELTVQYVEITGQSGDIIVAKGQLASFSVTAIGVPDPEYQWYKGVQILDGKTNSILSFYCDFPDTGSYKCKVYNAAGEIYSDLAILTVVGNPWRYNLLKLQSDIDRS